MIFCLVLVTSAEMASADGDERSFGTASLPTPEATPNQASDASFDKRLPPVLPGEIMNDSGQKMKVWSTAGPVPVSKAPTAPEAAQAPEPFNDTKVLQPDSINVIVDDRVDRKRHGRPQYRNSDTEALSKSGIDGDDFDVETNISDEKSLGRALEDAGLK